MIDYSRINFENYPKITTPLNAANFNKLDKAIYDIDQGLGQKTAAASVEGETVFAKIGNLYTSIGNLSTAITNKVTVDNDPISSIDFSVDGTTLTITTTTLGE